MIKKGSQSRPCQLMDESIYSYHRKFLSWLESSNSSWIDCFLLHVSVVSLSTFLLNINWQAQAKLHTTSTQYSNKVLCTQSHESNTHLDTFSDLSLQTNLSLQKHQLLTVFPCLETSVTVASASPSVSRLLAWIESFLFIFVENKNKNCVNLRQTGFKVVCKSVLKKTECPL